MKENTVWILTYMLLVAAFAYVIGWVSGELVCRCKNAEEKLSELSQQREHSCSGTEQQRQFKELRSVLNDVHKHIVAVSKAVKIPGSHRFGRSTRCGLRNNDRLAVHWECRQWQHNRWFGIDCDQTMLQPTTLRATSGGGDIPKASTHSAGRGKVQLEGAGSGRITG